MPTPIETALISLVPTINHVPQELLDLSTSLLAQSRAKAANLKPDEEIGRVFCCAHLAVTRLKKQLDLPDPKANPPVPPRVYKKLFSYLDSALKQNGTPRTPRHRDAVAAASARGTAGSLQNTPTSTRTRALRQTPVANTRTPGSGTRAPGSGVGFSDSVGEVLGSGGAVASGGRRSTRLPPKTVDPVSNTTPSSATSRLPFKSPGTGGRAALRNTVDVEPIEGGNGEKINTQLTIRTQEMAAAICAAFDVPAAEKHVLDGCNAVLSMRGWDDSPSPDLSPGLTRKRTREERPASVERGRKRRRLSTNTSSLSTTTNAEYIDADGKINVGTLPALLVALSLYTVFTIKGEAVSGDQYNDARDVAIAALTPLISDRTGAVEETEEQTRRTVALFLRAAHTEGWLELEWARAVQEAAAANNIAAQEDGSRDVEMGDAEPGVEEELASQQEAEAEILAEEDQVVDEIHLRTPRKSQRPVRTPLRRKEKHAPRPSLSGAGGLGTVPEEGDAEAELGKAGLRSGLGTMFQDAVDWLSAEREENYQDWEGWIRSEIARIESHGQGVVA